jgi:hypothetical protein
MDKESIFELQKIDCNCNDCKFMVRDFEKFKQSIEFHHKLQLDYFNTNKQKLVAKAKWYRYEKGDLERWNDLLIESEKLNFVFDKSTACVNYGSCSKLNKDVSFIPNTCQSNTQECFQHRKETI